MDKKIKNTFTVWFTGLSGSGKTTFAKALRNELYKNRIGVVGLDGDKIRKEVNKDLGYSMVDREENNRRAARIAKIINDSGIHVVCSLITPTNKIRATIKEIIGAERLILVYVKTSIKTCEERDDKQLYKKARAGLIDDFTGVSSAFEEPRQPDLVLDEKNSFDENFQVLLKYIKGHH